MQAKQVFAVLTLCSLFGFAGVHMQQKHPDLSTPKAAVRSFEDGLARRDFKYLAECVQDANSAPEVELLLQNMPRLEFDPGILIAEIDGDRCHVAAELRSQVLASDQPGLPSDHPGVPTLTVTTFDMFTLQRQGDTWHILPDPEIIRIMVQPGAQELARQVVSLRPLAALATLLGGGKALDPFFATVRARSQLTTCMSNQKQIALGILQYAEAHDYVYPPKKASYIGPVMPYVKHRNLFTCPLDEVGQVSYTMNANLQGVSLGSLVSPQRTVLLYEGNNMQLSFRHGGKAVVTFADASVKLIGPDQAHSLFWYPTGTRPNSGIPVAKPHNRSPRRRRRP